MRYIQKPSKRRWYLRLLSNERDNEVLQVHTDHLGTPRAVTNSNSETLWKWEGDAFGSQSPQVEMVKMPLRMAGQYFDSESELFYKYFRYYDPKTGRYVTSDPIGLEGGLNTFGYVGGSPLHFIDSLGLKTQLCSNIFFTQIEIARVPIISNAIRHDFLLVNSTILEHLPAGSPLASDGLHMQQEYTGQQGGYCTEICDDPLFDKFVLESAQELDSAKYTPVAFVPVGNYYNCQAWARKVLDLAKEKYADAVECDTCGIVDEVERRNTIPIMP